MKKLTRDHFLHLDQIDSLAKIRDEFSLAKNLIYFDGNSLGALPKRTIHVMEKTIQQEWGKGLVLSWNNAGWINLPRVLGDKIAPLIGAKPGEVVVVDSTSINLFKLLVAALRLNKNRKVIVSEAADFPSDLYILEGVIEMLGGDYERRLLPVDNRAIEKSIDASTAVVMLSHVNFKTGSINDILAITRIAHEKGALVIWDLSHSVGALALEMHNCNVDFAVGSTYKHLNGGPGAPAFLYVNSKLIHKISQPLTGWLGHSQPFSFSVDYQPANDIGKFICGTPPILAFKALESSLELFERIPIKLIHEKGNQLSEMFIQLMQQECGTFGFELLTPKNVNERGLQISFSHSSGYSIVQALISHNIICDFREPDVVRFGSAP